MSTASHSLDPIQEQEEELIYDASSSVRAVCAGAVASGKVNGPPLGGINDGNRKRERGRRRREASGESVESAGSGSTVSTSGTSGGGGMDQYRSSFAEAKALFLSGQSLSPSNPYAATLHFRQAATVFREIPGQKKRVEKCLWMEGMCWARMGMKASKRKEKEAAGAAFEEAQALFHFIGETSKEAMALYQLGRVTDDVLTAAEHLKRAATLFGETNEEAQEAMAYAECANLFGHEDPDTAIFFLKQCLLLYMKLSDSNKEGKALFAIGSLAVHLDKRTAHNYYLQARVIFRRRHDLREDANCSYQLGKICVAQKSYEAAVAYFEEASTLFHQLSKPVDEAWAMYRLALVMLKVKNSELAVDYLTEARKLFAEAKTEREAEGSCLMRMGEILGESNPPLAKALLEEALDYTTATGSERIGRRSTLCLKKLEDRTNRMQARKQRYKDKQASKLDGVEEEEEEEEEPEEEEEKEGRDEEGIQVNKGLSGGEAWWAVGS
ncbi:hypothetical protein JCM11641_004675 [Rhodosporidiobolus odoratus]